MGRASRLVFLLLVSLLLGAKFLSLGADTSVDAYAVPMEAAPPYEEDVVLEAQAGPAGTNEAWVAPPPAPAPSSAPEPYFNSTTIENNGHPTFSPAAPETTRVDSILERILSDPKKFKLLLSGLLTLVTAPLALFAVFGKGVSQESRKWAYTTLGTLLGYWLS